MFASNLFDRPFGRMFRDFEREMEDMERQVDGLLASMQNGTRQPIVWGYTLHVGPDGNARFQPFGNTGVGREQLEEGWREPFCTSLVDEEQDTVRVTAELPGVNKDQIEVETLPDSIRIEAQGEQWKYRKVLPMTVRLDPDSAEAHYNNGILEVTVRLAEPVRPKGHKVKVR